MIKRFKESLDTAVFTTKFVLSEKSPILYVFHYEEDGSWQFSGSEENLTDDDYKVISLKEMINLDSSVLDISDLSEGYMAYRKTISDSWVIEPII
ncbi:hypothetical protein [Sphingobacterium siyangense]|uniref:hypothetical protein n=1 Tax=Sphingobacterium siyangense TaxID=459529 RepID=UPI001964FB05|nr:hypothetical protein [Sphingobacterium siyangense]QRY55968.1 hypothetical protein JVX97_18285 [Sphingobacterium siyangense]